ncbi:hypothetical protein FRB94_014288 [Tulasnella sp. JGI-2019a]|nr:hypothetical protein FRB93_000721 [Tulasnella sp. JGI-2019a]KAG9007519.1 hypothetical protein FRB94_014288 [Tulasnella sp. JGI-2019a]
MAPGRRGPDKKPGRMRGPSRSSASIGNKKQHQKQIQRANSTRTREVSAPDSLVTPRNPPQFRFADPYQPQSSTTALPKALAHARESNISLQPPAYSSAIVPPMPVSQVYTPPTFSADGIVWNTNNIPTDNQAQIYPVPDERQREVEANNDTVTSFRRDRTETSDAFRVHEDARQRPRQSLNDPLIPSPSTQLMPLSSSTSSQFSSSSTRHNSGRDLYSFYPPGVGPQSIYVPTPSTMRTTTNSWVPAPSPSSYPQTFTIPSSTYDKERAWDTQEQARDANIHHDPHLRYQPTLQRGYTNTNTIIREPSLHFSCETWWDTVLYIYGTDQTSLSDSLQPLSWHGSRHNAAVEICNDVYSFFNIASNWLSFINVPIFFGQFHHAESRAKMQPSLVLGILAYFKFLQTSQEARLSGDGNGNVMFDETERMWKKSAMLRELAQSAFDASYNAGWIDTPLAQAAWILGLYEFSAHRDSTSERKESSLIILDNVVHVLGLKTLDRSNLRAAVFKTGAVPAFGRLRPEGQLYQRPNPSVDHGSQGHVQTFLKSIEPPRPSIQYQATTQRTPFDLYRSLNNPTRATPLPGNGTRRMKGCPCHALSLAGSSEAQKSTPLWLSTPKWDPNASLAEIQKEEARRLVWSTVTVVGADAAARMSIGRPQLNLQSAKLENYAVLLPGEELYASRPEVDVLFSGKESTWALHGRTMLLWYACVTQIAAIKNAVPISFLNGNVNGGLSFTPEQLAAAGPHHADFAMRAWVESLAIEEALNEHTCDGEKATMYQARETLFTIRMFITGGFRQYVPHPRSGVDFSRLDHEKAMQWLHHQNNVANQLQTIIGAEHSPARHLLIKRPYVMWWQMGLIGRALQLWLLDHSLTFAVDVALNIYPVMKWFERVWPCPEQQRRSVSLLGYLTHICSLLGKQIPI